MNLFNRALASGVIVLSIIQFSCTDQSRHMVETRILNSEKLSEIDRVCSELPKPDSFRQVRKGLSGNANLSIIFYEFSSEQSFNSVADFYKSKSLEDGFVLTGATNGEMVRNDIRLEREGVKVVIENRNGFRVYGVDCMK